MGSGALPQVMATLLGARIHQGIYGQRFSAVF